jgi:predicted DNA-binding transcriptional regulator AlpA
MNATAALAEVASPAIRYVDPSHVAELASVSKATILTWARTGAMPKPVRLGPKGRVLRWPATTIDDWLASRSQPCPVASGSFRTESRQPEKLMPRQITTVASIETNWFDVCTTPSTADNSGNAVVQPGSITRDLLAMGSQGTLIQVRLKYPTSATVTTSPVVQLFGKDGGGLFQRLSDIDGIHQQTLSVDTSNDVRDGTYSYTQPIEVDADACSYVLAAIKTALAGSGLTGATIQARVK